MNLGFIGTGEITKAVVIGILNSNIKFNKIFLSKRNDKISNFLKKKSKKIIVSNDNQSILNKSNIVFLAITPKVGEKIIKNLKFKKKHKVISFISTIKLNELKKNINVKCDIVRAIPLPPISLGTGPIPIYPSNKLVKNFFKDEIVSYPKDIPVNNNVTKTFNCIAKKIKPSHEEIAKNSRSRSAVMRVFKKL